MPTRMERREQRIRRFRKEMLRCAAALAVVAILAILVRSYVFSFAAVQGPSMMDTLVSGQMMAVDKTYYALHEPKYGQVIICRYPNSREYYVKRIIGLAGDEIEIRQGVTYVNGIEQQEDYVTYRDYEDFGPYRVPEDSVFVLGDNRANSHDSRTEGALSSSAIVGRAIAVVFPLNEARLLRAE